MRRLTPSAPASATSPLVRLVNLDGTPLEPAAACPAAACWPAWTDLVRVRLGTSDDDLERLRLSVGLGDALTAVVWRADNLERVEPDDDDGLAAFDAAHPVREPRGLVVPPVSGGAPAADRSLDVVTLERVATALHGDRPTAAV